MSIAFLFVETMVAVRWLDTESYGVYVLLTVVVGFLVMVVDFGCKTAATQLIAGSVGARQGELASTALQFRVMVVILGTVVVLLGRNALLWLDPSAALLRYVVYIPIMLLVVSVDELFLAVLQGFQAFHHMAYATIIHAVLRLGLSVLFLGVLDLGMMGLIYSWIVSSGVSATYQYLVLPHSKRLRCQRPLLGEMLRFGLPLQGNRLLWFASGRVDVLLLGMLVGPAGVAYYNVATRIPTALMRLTQSYIAVYFPSMTELVSEGKRKQAHWLLDHSLRLISFALGVIALTAVLFSQQIVTLLFSEKYAPSSTVFALLMIALPLTVVASLMGYTLTAAGSPGRSFGANVVQTTLSVLANLVLIPLLGFAGPALASMTAYYVTNPLCVWFLRRSNISVTVTSYVRQTALLWLCAGLFWWTRPTAFVLRLAMILLFVVLNVALSAVSLDDLMLVLPKGVAMRMGIRKEALSSDPR